MSNVRKIPTFDIHLSGASKYPKWTISIKKYLDLIPIMETEYRVLDIVSSDYMKPEEAATSKEIGIWNLKDKNMVALITIRKNCEEPVKSHIGNISTAKEAYAELKKDF